MNLALFAETDTGRSKCELAEVAIDRAITEMSGYAALPPDCTPVRIE